MASSKAATFRWLSTIALMTLCLALVVGMLPRIQTAHAAPEVTTPKAAASGGNEASSSDGRIKVSVTANPTEVPAGGGEVTYTYTVTNTRDKASYVDRFWQDELAQAMFFSSTRSNVCDNIVWESGYKKAPWGEYYLPMGATTTGTCTTAITQGMTNTFETVVEDYYGRESKATASATVSVKYSEGSLGLQCDGLWFSSGSPKQQEGSYGVMGTVNLKDYSTTARLGYENIQAYSRLFPHERRSMNGSAAQAVDPKNPENVYYIPRLRTSVDYSPAGLWVYNAKTGENHLVTTYSETPATARLGAAPDGTLWAVAVDGFLYKFDPQIKRWEKRGDIEPGTIVGTGSTSQKYTFIQGLENSLDSGDLAFDGLGNMWLIGSNYKTKKAFLYTISQESLQGQGSVKATMVGDMGAGRFNGIAFGPDGKLYGTTRDDSPGEGGLYLINKTTGTSNRLATLPYSTEDLGSCSLPKPILRIEKTANLPKGKTAVTDGGEIEYSVTIENTGNLEATGVNFKDMLADHKMAIVTGTATLNGEKWDVDFTQNEVPVKSLTATYPGTVAAGDTATIKFRARGKPGQTKLCNSAVVNFTGTPERKGILTDDPNTPGPNDPTCTPVYTPAIGIDKKGVALTSELGQHKPKSVVWSDDRAVRYIYYVSTDPNQPKDMAERRDANGYLTEGLLPSDREKKRGTEDLKDVVVSDDRCKKVDPVLTPNSQRNIGDRNSDGLLNPDELWQYQCIQENLSLTQSIKNTATVTATSVQSQKRLEDKDTWTVEPVGFKVEKTAKVSGENGRVEWKPTGSPIKLNDEMRGTATYRVTVTNTGLVDTFAPAVKDVFTTPKGFFLEKLSWAEVDEKGNAGNHNPLTDPNTLPKVRIAPGASKTYEITAEVSVKDATQVDWEKVGQCKTDNAGNSEYGLFNRVTMPHDDDGDENNDACVPVTSPLLTMSVTKLGNNCDTDKHSCELAGASFALYNVDPTSAEAKPLADGVVVDASKPSRFTSKGLTAGTYWLVETAAPNGHVLMAEPVKFQLAFDGIKILSTTTNASVASDDKFNVRVVDQTAGELPQAGGDGPIAFILMGLLLVAIGSVGYLKTTGYGPTWGRNRKHSRS
ncbi:SpaA isopeptide-forming pilin-related protein [Trueperella pyogenes]|uniref:SpaA isopeptide-forming pilin-related protein n=1 Tax=Trueperella pyogenes TaxID=1661 RepID=UPI00216A637B|nr:SpaA isopeptide-forming pilin-related protein [Trueperella pyogenes]UVJ57621.1 SpaA isopeptide-forming pilin-related protein [Trueperella pyogenes]